MKYLKISSLIVLSLLLFVPSALAQVECEVAAQFNQRIRMESEMEMLDALTVRCDVYWKMANIDAYCQRRRGRTRPYS